LLWSSALGSVRLAGVEGTGSYGASLSRYLRSKGVEVLEVERPRRHDRRHLGKSDPTDAELAARSVLSGTFSGPCKSADGSVEMIRILRSTRRSALKARTQAVNQLRALLVTAPDDLRSRLSGLSLRELVSRCSCLRSGPDPSDVLSATKLALRSVSRRYLHLSDEISVLDSRLARLVASASPQLLSLPGLGTDTAASLLIAVGDNPDRLLSESSFAHLCGVAPIPASSGKVQRHRLNRGGNRDANCALYRIALTRMSHCQRTRDYVARRTSEGKSKKEIIRCLKRYIAREVYKILKNSQDSS
jgi:transposase